MIRDSETGNIEYINYESYELLKEELEQAREVIEMLKEDNEYLKEQLKKDSLTAMNESKQI